MGTLFDHLTFVRGVTLRTADDYDEKEAIVIPKGFNNHILWNLGHIYLFTEQFVFSSVQEYMQKQTCSGYKNVKKSN